MKFPLRSLSLAIVVLVAMLPLTGFAAMLKGVNLAGGEFAAHKLPGVHQVDYLYPTPAMVSDYSRTGMNVIRVPFLWERVQPDLNGKLNEAEMKYLDALVEAGATFGMTVVLDMHNYGKYREQLIGSKAVPQKAYTNAWKMLAKRYAREPHVVFGIMNEPHQHNAADWAKHAKAALQAIRSTGAKQMVLVPGTLYTGAHSWFSKAGKLSNAEALAGIKDPARNIAIEFHHYFDYNYSGTHNDCTLPEFTQKALIPVSDWLRKNKLRGFLGEFGTSKEPTCMAPLRKALEIMQANSDVWAGWTYWGASAWFGEYPLNIYPPDESKFPQFAVLKEFLK